MDRQDKINTVFLVIAFGFGVYVFVADFPSMEGSVLTLSLSWIMAVPLLMTCTAVLLRRIVDLMR